MKRQAGFTLIELVMVIVILGILSAFALPRFADLGGDARKASLQAAYGSMQSASSISHADCLVSNCSTEVTLEGQNVEIVNKYPQALALGGAGGILEASQITAADFAVVGAGGVAAGASIIVRPLNIAVANILTCQITYTAAAANASPGIVLAATNCD